MAKFTGTIVKEVIVKDKVIITALKMADRDKPTQLVVFPAYRDAEVIDTVKAFQVNDTVTVYGKEESNPKTKELQIIINKAFNAKSNNVDINTGKRIQNAEYAVDANVDFIIGGMSSYNNKVITMSEPRKGHEQYYTDGDYYWYKGDRTKAPTSF
jgi:hypothetical protein